MLSTKRGETVNTNKLATGAVLIVIGIIFLLINLGYISFSILFGIFDLWPLILIVVGINVLFKNKSIVSFITWTLFFIILVLYGLYYGEISNIGTTGYNTNFKKPIETLYGELDLDIGAAKINIESAQSDLLNASLQGSNLDYTDTYKNNKETAVFNFKSKNYNKVNLNNKNNNYSFKLNKDVIWDLDFDLGAVSGVLNFEEIPIRSMDLDFGAGNLDIILGSNYSKSKLKIDSGASNLNILIPENTGIKIKLDTALTKTNIDNLNLSKEGDYYVSSNYEEASTKLDFDIDMGVGKVDFKIIK